MTTNTKKEKEKQKKKKKIKNSQLKPCHKKLETLRNPTKNQEKLSSENSCKIKNYHTVIKKML